MPGSLCVNYLVLYGEVEQNLKVMVEPFVGVCRRRGLKVKADKSKVIVLDGEGGVECGIRVDVARWDQVSEFKYFGCVLDNQVQVLPNDVGRYQVEGKLQVLSGPWLKLGVCSLSVRGYCMRHCPCLVCCMAVRQ